MKLNSPHSVWSQIYRLRFGKKIAARGAAAKNILTNKLLEPDPNRPPTILVIDEVDLLITPNENILYEIYGLPHVEGSKLSLITICNTLDIGTRVKARIQSRASGMREYQEIQI